MITDKSYCASSFRRGVTTHSIMENNDGQQEAIDGTGTTYDNNIKMFQLPTKDEMSLPTIGHQHTIPDKLSETLEEELSESLLDPHYSITKRKTTRMSYSIV